MSVYLQFDSSARANPFIIRNDLGNQVLAVSVATTGNLSLIGNGTVTYTDGDQTLTPVSNGQLKIDSVYLVIGNRVLVKNQTNPAENGVYIVTNAGSTTSTWILTRASDWNEALVSVTPIDDGTFVQVGAAGALNGNTTWQLTAGGNITQVDPIAGAINAPFLQNALWFPNDLRYSLDQKYQSPSNYRVYFKELNDYNNIRTIGFLKHCKERPENLNYSVEFCTLVIPANALIARDIGGGDVGYTSVLSEPYLYVRMMPIENAEGKLVYGNNIDPVSSATFVVYHDKIQSGPGREFPTVAPFAEVTDPPIANNVDPYQDVTGVMEEIELADITIARWHVYKSCMSTVMRLNLSAEEWQIRIYDRFGNDLVIYEDDNAGAGIVSPTMPNINPSIQTMLLVGIKPNYPL